MTPPMSKTGDDRAVDVPVRVPPPRRHQESCPSDEGEHALLPSPAAIADLPGLRVAVRYQAAAESQGAGGDWYLASPAPGGRVLISVGDVAGHGRAVIPGMLRLYHGLAALSMTGESPARLLGWLGDLVETAGPEHTASALAGYFDPATRTLCWAQAGHPPPVLVSGDAVSALGRPAGVLLGAPSAGYQTMVTTLRPGDFVLLYTDGLFERRDLLLEEGAATAFSAARGQPDPEAAASAVMTAAGPNPGDDTCLLVLQVR
jgi:serine phosphatase RsbU (regulator of sigma subunit)